jgi:hypothetical protein
MHLLEEFEKKPWCEIMELDFFFFIFILCFHLPFRMIVHLNLM